jgi:lysophospholipase L1-like esterase
MTDERIVLCYGDSNTWGFVPAGGGARFPRAVRWPTLLQGGLGQGYRVVDEGLTGRTTVLDDPLAPHRNGRDHLVPSLLSHRPISLAVIYLGTNDLAARYGRTASEIARDAGSLAVIARASATGPEGGEPAVLLVAPPALGSIDAVRGIMAGAPPKARELPAAFARAAAELDVSLLDLSAIVAYSDLDGIHLDVAGHAAVADAVLREVGRLGL